MENKTIRIRTTPNGGDKYIKTNISQDFDFIEILSLRITQEETYRKFCSDYGVIVGRVVINSGFGVPNAKVSVFVPLDAVDKNDPLIKGLYPYEILTDKNSDGIRYNILPKESETNNDCFTPIGTFPTKREVLDNDTMLGLYCKYYKFTTTTNYAGDFMLFGVPVGTHTVHVDADISDIGEASQRPYDLIRQGTPPKMFASPTKFKGGTNLDKLVQVKSANAGVNVQPFWGDTDNCEIGITRLDIDLNYSLIPAAIFVGSIYGDQQKHSVNQRCTPRGKLGEMCEQVTGPGSVEMIRKTVDNEIEQFDVEGGRLIDDDGTWAYQVPMNLDYVVTDEVGNIVLSQDPNIGIPTRASVRFKITMDETGGEGRLRTRAKYLVPNNPKDVSQVDYDFDSNTKDTSFKDLYWNKIYTVSNFITRYQPTNILSLTKVKRRGFTGMKNVDACAGDKTPFPFNKVNTQVNPIFFITCLFVKIIGFIIFLINYTLIYFLNKIIKFLKTLKFKINYVACITVTCATDDGDEYFAPGCHEDDPGRLEANPQPSRYCDDPEQHDCKKLSDQLVGWDKCMAFEAAKSSGMFQFDFYNDWVNGSLFSFLLKYKKRRKGREVFCEFDCADFVEDKNYSGVDGNNNGIPDNKCHNHILLDTCYVCTKEEVLSAFEDCQNKERDTFLREGLVKKYKNELYYAATSHDTNLKLFATDIICLGSVLNCDWQGFPKLQQHLVQTTYKIPPDINELGGPNNDDTQVITSGMVNLGGSTSGLFFDVNCVGLHVNSAQCLNIRHICEMYVDIDQAIENPLTGVVDEVADYVIGSNDINDDLGKEFRDSFLALNSASTSPNSFIIAPNGLTSDFNTQNTIEKYDFTRPDYNGLSNNGQDYLDFRGYPIGGTDYYSQPKHSFYMYFGILPGKTSLDKMNQRYFTPCVAVVRDSMLIEASATADTAINSGGTITFTIIGGNGPYTYTITGPSGYTSTGSVDSNPLNTNESDKVEITGLPQGSYTITAIDSIGTSATQTVVVGGKIPLNCYVSVTHNVTTNQSNDGEITIASVNGGKPPYGYILTNHLNAFISGAPNIQVPLTISNLGVDSSSGYTVMITDANGDTCVTTGLTISGPSAMTVTPSKTDVTCYNGFDGSITFTIEGGTGPYQIITTGPDGSTDEYNAYVASPLSAGVYQTTVIDSFGTTVSIQTTITSIGAKLAIVDSTIPIYQQCDPSNYTIRFKRTDGIVLNTEYSLDEGVTWTPTITQNNGDEYSFKVSKPLVTSSVMVRFSDTPTNDCYSNELTFNVGAMPLPYVSLTGSKTFNNNIYTVTGNGGLGVISVYAGLNGSGALLGVINGSFTTLPLSLKDSVGCTYNI